MNAEQSTMCVVALFPLGMALWATVMAVLMRDEPDAGGLLGGAAVVFFSLAAVLIAKAAGA